MINVSIAKAIHPQSKRPMVFSNSNGSNLALINFLVDALKADFPDAYDSEIEIHTFDNIHYKGMKVVTYNNYPNFHVPSTYQELTIDQVRLQL
jgi:ribosomal protein L31